MTSSMPHYNVGGHLLQSPKMLYLFAIPLTGHGISYFLAVKEATHWNQTLAQIHANGVKIQTKCLEFFKRCICIPNFDPVTWILLLSSVLKHMGLVDVDTIPASCTHFCILFFARGFNVCSMYLLKSWISHSTPLLCNVGFIANQPSSLICQLKKVKLLRWKTTLSFQPNISFSIRSRKINQCYTMGAFLECGMTFLYLYIIGIHWES